MSFSNIVILEINMAAAAAAAAACDAYNLIELGKGGVEGGREKVGCNLIVLDIVVALLAELSS